MRSVAPVARRLSAFTLVEVMVVVVAVGIALAVALPQMSAMIQHARANSELDLGWDLVHRWQRRAVEEQRALHVMSAGGPPNAVMSATPVNNCNALVPIGQPDAHVFRTIQIGWAGVGAFCIQPDGRPVDDDGASTPITAFLYMQAPAWPTYASIDFAPMGTVTVNAVTYQWRPPYATTSAASRRHPRDW